MREALRQQQGFTLLEIMVVVIIIGTLAGLVGIKVLDRLEQARVAAAKVEMSTLRDALDLFKMDNGFYPTSDQGLAALVSMPQGGRNAANYRPGGYLRDDKLPVDPWGDPYLYQCDDGYFYTIMSMGPDSKPGTPDDITP
jgi:general secretion pathway protein G